MTDIKQEILEAVKNASQGGQITCATARQLAEEFEVSYQTIGEAANVLKIKIKDCGLGCF